MATTIYDVAQKANVSISTVSRVINKNPNVNEETRRRILQAVEELNFKPNPIARGLVIKQTGLIEVFFSWSGFHVNLHNAWYLDLLNGIHQVVEENKYGLLINTVSGEFDPKEVYRRVYRNAVDGILMISPYLEEKDLKHILEHSIPVVLIGYRMDDPNIDFVDSDNTDAAVRVVDHLVKLGHKKIACMTGPVKTAHNAADRLVGFKSAMQKHGLNVAENYVVDGGFLREPGMAAMGKLLDLPEKPTAVFACNDLMALGAWDAIENAGLEVGRDVALVGFDDISQASAPHYPLTTVRQAYRSMSEMAARMLIEKIKDPGRWKPRQITMPTELIVRRSCGAKPPGEVLNVKAGSKKTAGLNHHAHSLS